MPADTISTGVPGLSRKKLFRVASSLKLFPLLFDTYWSIRIPDGHDFREIARFTPSTRKLRITGQKFGPDEVIDVRGWREAFDRVANAAKRFTIRKRR